MEIVWHSRLLYHHLEEPPIMESFVCQGFLSKHITVSISNEGHALSDYLKLKCLFSSLSRLTTKKHNNNNVIMGVMASQVTNLTIVYSTVYSDEDHRKHQVRWHLKSPTSRLFTQLFIQTQIIENIKTPHHWPLCVEFTGDQWIPRTNGQ